MIVVLIPARGRPECLAKYLRSLARTAANPKQVIARVALDADDVSFQRWKKLNLKIRVTFTLRHRENVPQKVNFEAKNEMWGYPYPSDVLLIGNDDFVMETPGWDEIISRWHAANPFTCLCINDGHDRPGPIASITCQTKNLLGYFCHPAYWHYFPDTDLADVFNRADRLYYAKDVVCRHDHPIFGGPSDDQYEERKRSCWEHDEAEFARQADRRAADAAKLRAVAGV